MIIDFSPEVLYYLFFYLLTLFYIGFLSHNNICIYIYKYHNKSYLLQKNIKIDVYTDKLKI